ncbi:MAG TPA: hypothetical protein VJ767_07585 [Nitrososphaeraceae archaeon]|nr:hypothetical protein [Nitrososphaeraceae archaeon]
MSNNQKIVFASILGAILATGLLALNPSMVGNAEALISGELGGFCLKYPEFCEVDILPSGTSTCPAGSDLEGVVVLEENANVICNIDIPELITCPAGTELEGAIVTDPALCDSNNIELLVCPPGTNLEGALVTDLVICDLN